jgi:hypothetical protein
MRSSERVVLLVRTRGDGAVVTRLRAELGDSGWTLRDVAANRASRAAPLGHLAARFGARAAVRVDIAHRSVQVWVDQKGGAVSETLRVSERDVDDRVLAL